MHKTQFEKLYSKRLYWSCKKNRIPQDLQKNYHVELFIDQIQLQGEIKQKIYLNFKHKITKEEFQVIIDDHNVPKSCMHFTEIVSLKEGGYKATLKQAIDEILFTTIQNYNKTMPRIKEIENKQRKPYESDSEIQDYLNNQLANSEFDSDEEQSQTKMTQKDRQDQSDPSIKKDRFKKIKEIKSALQQMGFTITDAKLKQMLTSICGTHLFDRKKGYLIKDQLLSNQQRQKRDRQIEQQERQQLQKQGKKGNKKESKKMTNKQLQKTGQLTSLFGDKEKAKFKNK